MSHVQAFILAVNCRHCGIEIPVESAGGDSKEFEALLAEVERQSEAKHRCELVPENLPSIEPA